MATTYDPTKIKDGGRDEVRFLVGDTGPGFGEEKFLISDEEVDAILVAQPVTLLAASEVADSIAARFSRQADTSVSKIRVSKSQRADGFRKLAKRLRGQAGVSETESGRQAATGVPFAGGLSRSEKEALDLDTDATQPFFRRDSDDNPSADGRITSIRDID